MKTPERSVAIVIPCYKASRNACEQLAWRRIWELYGHLPIVLIAPPGLDASLFLAERPTLRIERFPFHTVREYSQLLLQREFYERFRAFDYILIHQLDAYLLRDELAAWCQRGFDYVGAPLFHGFEPAEPAGKLWRVGNGGFSLRRVEAAIKVLSSTRRYRSPGQHWAERPQSDASFARRLRWLGEGLLNVTRIHNDVRWATLSNFNEDIFWSVDAVHFWPEFRVPDIEMGLRFAFDYAPAYCYEQTGQQLPFGCHAWARYDPGFWRRFIPSF